jgi:hypothetical protein
LRLLRCFFPNGVCDWVLNEVKDQALFICHGCSVVVPFGAVAASERGEVVAVMQSKRLCVNGESPLADMATAPSVFSCPTVVPSVF